MSEHEDRGWLVRLLDGLKVDVREFRDSLQATDRIARSTATRVDEVERRMGEVEKESSATTISVVEIKAIAKTAGVAGGFVAGLLGAVLAAFILKLLHLT